MGKYIERTVQRMNDSLNETKGVIDTYVDYVSEVDYQQAHSSIPLFPRLVFLMFLIIPWSIFIYSLVNDLSIDVSDGSMYVILFIVTALNLLVQGANFVTKFLMLIGNRKKYIAIVLNVTDSPVTYGPKGPGKLVMMHIPKIDKYIHYETNGVGKVTMKKGDRCYVYVSEKFKLWDFVK